MEKDIVTIYEEILTGKRKAFPPYTWSPHKGGYDTFRRLFRYLVFEKLQLNREDLLYILERKFFRKWKLDGGLNTLFECSSLKALEYTFPEWEVKPWEPTLTITREFWLNEQNRIDAIRWVLLEKLEWDKEHFLKNFDMHVFHENKIGSLTSYYSSVSDLFIKAFPEWELTGEEFHKNRYKKVSENLKKYFDDKDNLKSRSGENSKINTLTSEQVKAMKEEYSKGGISQKKLGEKYGISTTQTNRILRGISWRVLHEE